MGEWIPVQETFIEINAEKCTGCGSCITICGGDVFELKEKKAVVARIESCLECGNCEIVCAPGAITYSVPGGGTGIVYTCG